MIPFLEASPTRLVLRSNSSCAEPWKTVMHAVAAHKRWWTTGLAGRWRLVIPFSATLHPRRHPRHSPRLIFPRRRLRCRYPPHLPWTGTCRRVHWPVGLPFRLVSLLLCSWPWPTSVGSTSTFISLENERLRGYIYKNTYR